MTESTVFEQLAALGTAALSGQLVKLGIRRHWIAGAMPLVGDRAVAGPAFTMRLIPGREDVMTGERLAGPGGLMDAVDHAPAGAVVVVEANGSEESGVFGDVLALRMKVSGVAGAVSDGVFRDRVGIERVGLPMWARGIAPPPATCSLFFAGYQLPIGVGGVAVFPGDVIVADADGAIVVPPTHVATVIEGAAPQEEAERYIVEQVMAGRRLLGLYPPTPAVREEIARWREKRG